jgi:lactate permease
MINFLLALIPILLILVLMLGLRWSAVRASVAGYLSALVLAVIAFGSGFELIAYAHIKALLASLDVLLIIWAAFLFYRVTDEARAVTQLGEALPHLTANRGMQALIIGWAFASFLQGVGGFGVPVAVVAPILLGLGFAPMAAIIIPPLAAVTVTLALGSSFQACADTGARALSWLCLCPIPCKALITGLMVALHRRLAGMLHRRPSCWES